LPRIDKFLEGLTDGADLPVNNDKKNDEIKTADLVRILH